MLRQRLRDWSDIKRAGITNARRTRSNMKKTAGCFFVIVVEASCFRGCILDALVGRPCVVQKAGRVGGENGAGCQKPEGNGLLHPLELSASDAAGIERRVDVEIVTGGIVDYLLRDLRRHVN